MPTARVAASAAAVGQEIFVVGGTNWPGGNPGLDVVEAYDVLEDTWAAKTTIPETRYYAMAAAVGERVYVVGGTVGECGWTSSRVWEYTPALDGAGGDPWMRRHHIGYPHEVYPVCEAACALWKGKIYLFGGIMAKDIVCMTYANWVRQSAAWAYDPARDVWERKTDLPGPPRARPFAVALGEKIYVIAGHVHEGPTDLVMAYDPVDDEWETDLAPFPGTMRWDLSAIAALDERICVVTDRAEVWFYDPAADRWEEGPPLPEPVVGPAFTTIDGRLFLVGGMVGDEYVSTVWVLERTGRFIRGDVDGDGLLGIGDGIQILMRLFAGAQGYGSNCDDTADIDDTGTVTIGDPIRLFNYLFADGVSPEAPFPACGEDPTPDDPLGCEGYPADRCP